MIFWRCAAAMPAQIGCINSNARVGDIAPSAAMMSCKDFPDTNSITRNGMVSPTTPKSVTAMMF